jgi:type IV pilus assembly protein PilQ
LANANAVSSNVMHKANFPNEDVRTIISSVATLFNLNVIIPDTLTGTTTIQLHDVTWQQIFKYVLDPLGYTYTVDGTGDNAVIQIKSKSDIAGEPMETRVIPVNSAQAADLAKSLNNFLDTTSKPPETIIPDARTNFLIVTAHPSKMNSIQNAIDRLDKPTQQVFIEAKFVEVQANDDKDLGISWNFNGTPLGSVGYAYQYGVYEGLGSINSSGALPGPGLPQLTVAQSSFGPTPANNLNQLTPSTSLNPSVPFRKALDLAFFNQAQYTAVLHALQTVTHAKLVSDSTAVTVDNQEITLYSGTTISVVFPSLNNQTGQTSPGEIKTYDIGVKLRVKPHVTNNGFINLTLNPELSRLDPTTDTYYNTKYPRFDTRKLTDANVSVKDGFTLAVGGLIDDQDSTNSSKVPFLGDIPFIGNLFKSTETIRQRNNLIIFVTARTLSNDGASYRDVVTEDTMLRTGLTAPEIPGYYYNKRSADTPGMVYPSKEETDTMDKIQQLRDEAAQVQNIQDYMAKLKAAQDALDASQKSAPKK